MRPFLKDFTWPYMHPFFGKRDPKPLTTSKEPSIEEGGQPRSLVANPARHVIGGWLRLQMELFRG